MTSSKLVRALSFAAIAAALAACGKGAAMARPGVPVTIAKAVRKSVPYEITATGTAEPVQTVAVVAQVGGLLSRVAF
jgi:multidrug efflux pump subunit AcrA (membrane-fusion protein)